MNAASQLRSVRAPLQSLAKRQYSSAVSSTASSQPTTVVTGHSNRKLAIVSGVSAAVGADTTYAYFTFFHKSK